MIQKTAFSPLFFATPLAFQYGKQICFCGRNERLQAESGRTAWALLAELGAEEAATCDEMVVLVRGLATHSTGPGSLPLFLETSLEANCGCLN